MPEMVYIETDSTLPAWNLATEEYCLKQLTHLDRIVMLWRNKDAVIIGRYQNALQEVNVEAAAREGVQIVRRPSGGGAVYHDLGNLCYTFISQESNIPELDMQLICRPMLVTLQKLGVPAELSGRNDLTINGLKISGTAQTIHQDRLMHHGTLLFNSDLDRLGKVLRTSSEKYASKGTQSVRSRVTNISDYLPRKIDILEFKQLLLETLFEDGPINEYHLTPEDRLAIRDLAQSKYSSWEWNIGESPPCNFSNTVRYTGGKLDVQLMIKNGLIETCRVYGDFLGKLPIEPLEDALVGSRYQMDEVTERISGLNFAMHLGGITQEQFLSCLFALESN